MSRRTSKMRRSATALRSALWCALRFAAPCVSLLALIASGLGACGGDDPTTPARRPRVVIDLDRSGCSTGCAAGAVEYEFIVLTSNVPLPCIVGSKRDSSTSGSTLFEGLDLRSGDELHVGVKLRCANDSCVRCWARQLITVKDGAQIKLVLGAMALGCALHGDVVFDNPVISTCSGSP